MTAALAQPASQALLKKRPSAEHTGEYSAVQ
jgi:hypothetical protein